MVAEDLGRAVKQRGSCGGSCLVDQSVSIIIPVWNGRALLPDCLDALLGQHDADCEIVAVDNGSTDGSAELITERYPSVRLLRNAQNMGFAQACNRGACVATGQVLVFLNQDTRVERGWLSAVRSAFLSVDAGVVGCKILSAADRSLQHAGGYVHDLLGVPFHYGKDDPDAARWNAPREVEYVTGAALAIQRRVIEQIGAFDERFFPAYYEDVDLCFRARAAGFKVLYWPDAVVLHHESTSTPSEARWFYFQRGRIRFVLKHWPFERLMDGFAAAETGFQTVFRQDFGNARPLRLAYTAARIEAATLAAERWPGDNRKPIQLSALLRQLHNRLVAAEFAQLHPAHPPIELDAIALRAAGPGVAEPSAPVAAPLAPQSAEPPIAVPLLTEYEFRSTIPLLGNVVAAIRRMWYAMAARWSVQHLIGQQNAANHIIAERLQQLTDMTADLDARQKVMAQDFDAQQKAFVRHFDDALIRIQEAFTAREARAAAVNRFLLDSIAEAEEETIFALLWPLRWDIVLDSTASQ